MLRCAASFVTAAYVNVRLIPHDLRALPAELFTKPSFSVILGCRVDHENFAAYLLRALPDLSSENPEAM
jgi:hypothetical protein